MVPAAKNVDAGQVILPFASYSFANVRSVVLGPELSETWSTFLEMLSLGLFEMRWYAEKARVLA